MYDIPFLDLPPLRHVGGRVALPGSKSISNRVLLLAALSAGRTELGGLLDSDDTRVMLAALQTLGCRVESLPDGRTAIEGLGAHETKAGAAAGPALARDARLFLGNAGTAMRPLTAALALLAAQQGGCYELSGVPRMHERPIGDLIEALRALGCTIDDLGVPGYPPLRLRGPSRLALDAPVRVRGDVSSQFLTALLLALPLAAAQRAIRIEVTGELISKPYIDITLNLLARFGIAVEREGYAAFTIPAGSRYRSPGQLWVEADASSASYFIAAGAIAATRQPLRIDGVGLDSIQGDIRFVDAARAMGAVIQGGDGWIEVRRGAWPLRALDLNALAIPDAAMTLAAMALYADGPCRIDGIASWRVKETDRIAAMACELRRVGAQVIEGPDFIQIEPPGRWRAAAFHTYDDHRMAMCLSLAAFNPLAAPAGRGAPQRQALPMRILEPRCVGKTFPDYFESLLAMAQADPAEVPVIAIDGPTASGKGTLAAAVARRLGWHLLDSGALYRATALAVLRYGMDPSDAEGVAGVAAALPLRFDGDRVWLAQDEISADLRREEVGITASKVAAHGAVRLALHALQLSFRRAPGLVADGRDMGTVVFPDAPLKVFLTASTATRAERRHKQLISKGIPATLADLRADLEARDERDRNRTVAPLKPAEDAQQLDNSALDIDQSVEQVLAWWAQRRPFD